MSIICNNYNIGVYEEINESRYSYIRGSYTNCLDDNEHSSCSVEAKRFKEEEW